MSEEYQFRGQKIMEDDISVGHLVTILHNYPIDVSQMTGEMGESSVVKAPHPFESYKGLPMKVESINFPYVVVKCYLPEKCASCTISIDIRQTDLMSISEDFAKSFMGEEYDKLFYKPIQSQGGMDLLSSMFAQSSNSPYGQDPNQDT